MQLMRQILLIGASGTQADVHSMEISTTIHSSERGMWLVKVCSYVMHIAESFHQPRQMTWLYQLQEGQRSAILPHTQENQNIPMTTPRPKHSRILNLQGVQVHNFLSAFLLVPYNSSYYIYYLLYQSFLSFSVSLIVLQISSPIAPVPVPQLVLKNPGHLSLLLLCRHSMAEGPLPRPEASYCSAPPTNLDPFDYWHIVHPA